MSTLNNYRQGNRYGHLHGHRYGSELFAECVVYNVNAMKASCNSEVFSRSTSLTISSLGKRRHG